MKRYFPLNHGRLIGVENEAWNIDWDDLWVANDATVDEFGWRLPFPFADAETFQSQTEWSFGRPVRSLNELGVMCRTTRSELFNLGTDRGFLVLATGTPLSEPQGGHKFSNKARTAEWIEDLGEQHLRSTSTTAAQHVHIDVGDLDVAVEVLNRIRPWLSTLDALMVNSPIMHGRFTGAASIRMTTWSDVKSFREDAPYSDSYADWEREALDFLISRGIDRNDPSRVHDTVRPVKRFGTVEARGADVALTSEDSELHALLVQGLVATSLIEIAEGKPPSVRPDPSYYKQARLMAATHGIFSELMNPRTEKTQMAIEVIRETLNYMTPGLKFLGTESHVKSLYAQFMYARPGAERQMATWAAINADRRRLGLEASDPKDVLMNAGEILPDELRDLTMALCAQSIDGRFVTSLGIMPDHGNDYLHGFLFGNPTHTDRTERLRDIQFKSGFSELEKLGFSFI